jgi:hypothetical protein
MVDRVGRIVGDRVPAGAKVAVVSRGDDRLTNFDNADGCHFPQIGGVYAGHHPADSADAIEQLESLRARGVDYLLFPRTAFWWLDYYDGFRSHLTQWYQEIVTDMDTCRVFALASKRRPRSDATDKQVATPSADPTEPVVA